MGGNEERGRQGGGAAGVWLAFLLLAGGAGTSAVHGRALEDVPPFDGDLGESFETFAHFNATGRTPIPCGTGVFDGAAVLLDSRAGIYEPDLSPFYILDTASGDAERVKGDGSQGLGTGILRGESAVTAIRFGAPVQAFGALWASAEDVVVRFLDAEDQVVGTTEFLPTPLAAFYGDLVWRGWSSTVAFVRVELEGVNVAVDDLQATLADGGASAPVFDELCNSGGSPVVATDHLGRSARLWAAADSLVDTSSVGVYVEVVDAGGRRIAGPARLSARVDGDQQQPALAVDPTGRFAAAWQEDLSGQSNVVVRTFSLEPRPGEPHAVDLVLGQERQINEPVADSGDQPQIAPRGGGEWAVAWRSRNRVLLRPVDANAVPVGGARVVADGDGGVVDSPALAGAPGGDLVVAWAFRASGAAARASAATSGVLAQRFDRDAAPVTEVEPASGAGTVPAAVDVTTSPQGSTLVVWSEDQGAARPAGAVVGRWLSGGGAPIGGPIEIGQGGSRMTRPRAATSTDGTTVVVWDSRPLAALRSPVGGEPRWSAATSGDPGATILGRRFSPGSMEPDPTTIELAASDDDAGDTLVTPDVSVPAKDDVRLVYAKEGPSGEQRGVFSKFVTSPGVCAPSAERLCLGEGRFAVDVSWVSGSDSGKGQAEPLTADTGTFWFFDSSNVELVVKILDGCAFNDRFWVYVGGLTDVGIELTVTDTFAGQSRVYATAAGSAFEPILDSGALATCGTSASSSATQRSSADGLGAAGSATQVAARVATYARSACVTGGDTLCVAGERFAVRVTWRTADGSFGAGHASQLTSDTGYFWFFDDENVEIVVKVLDACVLNDRFWVFVGGLTDVLAEIEVFDTVMGVGRAYLNPLGTPFVPIQDTSAFATCSG